MYQCYFIVSHSLSCSSRFIRCFIHSRHGAESWTIFSPKWRLRKSRERLQVSLDLEARHGDLYFLKKTCHTYKICIYLCKLYTLIFAFQKWWCQWKRIFLMVMVMSYFVGFQHPRQQIKGQSCAEQASRKVHCQSRKELYCNAYPDWRLRLQWTSESVEIWCPIWQLVGSSW